MASSESNIGNRGEPHASVVSDVLCLSKEAFVRKAAIEAGKYWDEMHARDASASVGNEVSSYFFFPFMIPSLTASSQAHSANKERFTFVCAAEKIEIVETSGRTHTKLVDTSPHSENPEHFAALFPNRELIGYASEPEHLALMFDHVQEIGADKKTLVSMRLANEDEFDEVNTPDALKTVRDNCGRIIRLYRN
ncbi:hypothetical protein FMUND_14338 [Fusarium mundagurra]|uniref:Uncharacterized protein n=1 Tax=Fusarium mundagurra TaxID=1567541 RepID=A0A8H5XVN8_9HYPO|nr:hypothetical protein FMUND_14338 [Fusarium mundagurra]